MQEIMKPNKIVTLCYIDEGKPVAYKGKVSEEDRRKMEALLPGSVFRWEEVKA